MEPQIILFWLVIPLFLMISFVVGALIIASPFLIHAYLGELLEKLAIPTSLNNSVTFVVTAAWVYLLYLIVPQVFTFELQALSLMPKISDPFAYVVVTTIVAPAVLLQVLETSQVYVPRSRKVQKNIVRYKVYLILCLVGWASSFLLDNDCGYELTMSGTYVPTNPSCR